MDSYAPGDFLKEFNSLDEFNFDLNNLDHANTGQNNTNGNHDQAVGNLYDNLDFTPRIAYDETFTLPSDLPENPAPPHSNIGSKRPSEPQARYPLPDIAVQHTNTDNNDFSGAVSTQLPSSFSGSGNQSPYYNEILNLFEDPAVPLRVIDNFFYPFPNSLVAVLTSKRTSQSQVALGYVNQALEPISDRQRQAERNSQFHGPQALTAEVYSPLEFKESGLKNPHLAVPQQTPRSQCSGTSTPGSKASKNKRKQNIKSFDACKYYKPLPTTPESWTAKPPGRAPTTFEYTIHGELTPARRFTNQEISDYLQYHPGHKDKDKGAASSSLRLWIQNTPADSRSRYPTSDSAKCRFESCPTKGGTTRTGEFRVCFDEQSWTGNTALNPYHNAGYVHLYCLEKNFNFHHLYNDFNVWPDDRKFPNEVSNRMAITRDRQSMLDVCEEYKNRDPVTMRAKAWNDTDNKWFNTSLTYALTKHHIENVPEHTRRTMEARGGFNISDHLGDLQKLAKYREEYLKEKNEEAKSASKARHRRKPSAEVGSDEEEEGGEDSDDLFEEPSQKKKKTRQH